MATPEEQKKRVQEIKAELNSLFARLDQADRTMLRGTISELQKGQDNLQEWERALTRFKTTADKVADSLDYISRSFTDAVNELQKQDKFLSKGKQAMNSIANTAQKALSIRRGETDINRKNLVDSVKLANTQRDILENAIAQGKGTEAQNRAMQQALNDIDEYKKGLEAVLKTDRKIENSIGATASILKGVEKTLGKFGLPAIGIEEAFKETKRLGQAAAMAGDEFDAFGEFSSILTKNIRESLSITKLLELAVLAVGKAAIFIDKTSGNIAKNLGIANSEARQLVSEFNSLSSSTMSVFVNTSNLSEAFGTLTKELGLAKFVSDEILINQIELTKQAGYTNEAAAELAKLGAIQGSDSKEVLSNFLGNVEALNIQEGLQINSKQLAESALKTSKATLLALQGQGKSLGAAAFEAKKLGLELQQIEGVADSLLNIESSIAAEFEAEVMLGRQLNLERARYYALTNDIAGLANEMKKEAGSANEFAAMNRIEAEGLAKAFGMSREAMGEMLYEQEALSKLSGKANEDAQTRFNNLVREVGLEKAKKQLGNEQLANQMESANIQQRFQKALLKIQTLFLSLAEPLMPVVDAFVGILGFVGGIVAKLTPFLKILTGIYAVTKAFQLSILAINKGLAIGNALTKIRLFFTKDLLKFGKFIINYEGISNALSKSKNVEKVKEVALSKTGNVQAKAAILLNKIGLINGKQLAFWKGRETFLSNANNTNLKQRIFYEKASLANSIRKNIAEKIGLALGFEKAAIEKVGLTTLIQQNIQKALGITRDTTSLGLSVAKGASEKMTLKTLIAQGAAMLISIARNTINLGITIAKAAAEFAAATALTLGIGTGPLLAIAAAAAATVGGIVYAMTRGDDVLSNSTGGSGYGDRMLLGPEGAISLNNKDTVVAGTDLFKGDDVISAGEGQIQMGDAIDYNKLASAIGGAVNNKQVTLSYTDFAQKTRPVFG